MEAGKWPSLVSEASRSSKLFMITRTRVKKCEPEQQADRTTKMVTGKGKKEAATDPQRQHEMV